MAKLSIEERIAQLEARKKSLQARLTKQDRAADTRRKVLLGAFLLARMEDAKAAARDPEFTARLRDWLAGELPAFLTRPNDRALFPEWIAQDSVGAPTGTALGIASGSGNGVDGSAHHEGADKEKDVSPNGHAGDGSPTDNTAGIADGSGGHASGAADDGSQRPGGGANGHATGAVS